MSQLDLGEIARYGRHLTLPEVGIDGQLRLRAGSVLVVGAGGLGSPAALYLAAAGVGRIGLVDFDAVDLSNLQRQILYGTADVGQPKLDRAAARLADVNPLVRVEPHSLRLAAANALDVLSGYDVVIDGTDNFPTRYLVNDACVRLGKPDVYGSIFRFEGQVSVFWRGHGPCYRCLYPEPPPAGAVPNCAEGGVLGVLPGIVGAMQAVEAIKILLDRGETLVGRLVLLDALAMRFRELRLKRDPTCPACGDAPTLTELVDEAETCDVPLEPAARDTEVTPRELRRLLDTAEPPLLVDVREPAEWQICRIPGARLVPLRELEARIGELDPERDTVVYCHVGGRSARAAALLRGRGFRRVRNLVGGIDAWAGAVDPALPRY